jgi:hypothetical protein
VTRRLVHGVRVSIESALRPDPSRSLLGRFPPAPDGLPADLTLRLRAAASLAPAGTGRLVMDL